MKRFLILSAFCLISIAAQHSDESQSHQEPLESFSAKCCPKGLFLHSENSTCVNSEGVRTGGQASLPHCPDGMYMLNPNNNADDAFKEINGQIELETVFFEEDEDHLIANGSWCAAYLEPELGNLTVALVCFEEDPEYGSGAVHTLYGVCLLVSCIFLIITLVFYVLLPELRDLQGHCLMANIFSLALGYFALSFIQLFGHSVGDGGCIFSAFFLYYWLLSAFFWLSIVAFNVWRTIVNQAQGCARNSTTQFFSFTAYGWGCPAILLCIVLAVHYAPEDYESLYRPRFGETSCWFHAPEETWLYFYGPISLIIVANMYFFVSSAIHIWRTNGQDAGSRFRSKKFKWMLYLKLFIVMGITWIFEVASFAEGSKSWFWYITDVLNCLQGIFFFCILICRQRVLRLISARPWGYKVLGEKFQEQPEELNSEDEEAVPEEIELANPS